MSEWEAGAALDAVSARAHADVNAWWAELPLHGPREPSDRERCPRCQYDRMPCDGAVQLASAIATTCALLAALAQERAGHDGEAALLRDRADTLHQHLVAAEQRAQAAEAARDRLRGEMADLRRAAIAWRNALGGYDLQAEVRTEQVLYQAAERLEAERDPPAALQAFAARDAIDAALEAPDA